MSENGKEPTLNEVKRSHYESMAPLIRQAREVLDNALDAEDEKVRLQAARYVLDHAEDWTDKAAGSRVEEIPEDEREDPMAVQLGPETTRTVKTVSPEVVEELQ